MKRKGFVTKVLAWRKFLLPIMIAIAASPSALQGDYAEIKNGIEWRYYIAGGSAVIGTGNSSVRQAISRHTSGPIRIPSELGGYDVKAIDISAFSGCSKITSVEIPYGVTEIATYAFRDCLALATVSMDYGVRTIGPSAFQGCTALTTIELPSSLTKIGAEAFKGCDHLLFVSLPSGVTEVEYRTFYGCERMTSAKFEGNVEILAPEAFCGCSRLRYVTLPKSLTRVGQDALRCSRLETIFIDSGDESRLAEMLFYAVAGAPSNVDCVSVVNGLASQVQIVVFDPCGPSRMGELSLQSTKIVVKGGCYGEMPEPGATYQGREFRGWFTEVEGGKRVTSTTGVNITGIQTLYAQWGDPFVSSSVVFDANGGDCEEDVRTIETGRPIGCLPAPQRSGYEFCGWYSSVDGGERIFEDTFIDVDMTVYAHWKPISYSIVYDLGGGVNAGGNPSSYTIEDGVSLLPPTRERYTFSGWIPDDGVICKGSTGDKVFTATWTKDGKSYVITFDANGGVCSAEPKSYKNGSVLGTLPLAARDEYTFDGWYTEASGGIKVTATTVVTGNMTLYAHWRSTMDDASIFNVEARLRYPWNGLVDITVAFHGTSDAVARVECTFAATNSATKAAIPVEHITRTGDDTGSGNVWARKFIWDAKADAGAVKIDDVAMTIDAKILGGVQLWENGPYWAECNIGASQPEEYGYYFWWGDTVGYKRNANDNGWISAKNSTSFSFSSGNCPIYGKNISQLQSAGYIDAAGNLLVQYDAATVHLGASWRMPTDAEFKALINNCDTVWTSRNGVSGRLVKGRGVYASKCIFLPAAGCGYYSNLDYPGSDGYYWSSTMHNSDYFYDAWSLDFYSGNFYRRNDFYLYYGLSVRPVRGFVNQSFAIGGVTIHLSLDCLALYRTVAFDPNGGNCSTVSKVCESGALIGVLPEATRNGYMFEGWFTAASGGMKVSAEAIVTEDVTLYAHWKLLLDGIRVIFNPNGGTGTMADMRCARDMVYALSKNEFRHATKRFVGWRCAETGRRYDDGMLVFNLAQPNGEVTMTAIWEDVGDRMGKLAHRWSFNGNLNDSAGNRTATAVGSVSSDGSTYTLSSDNSTVAYIDLGTGLFADGVTEFTIETWVTPYALGWRRVWDMADQFGQCWNGKENLMGVRDHISWTSYTTDVKAYIAVVCAALPGGSWSLTYYHLDAKTGAIISSYASTTGGSDWSPQKVGVNALLLGKSNVSWDPYGNASYDEFRIWNKALSEDELKKSVEKGPDVLP